MVPREDHLKTPTMGVGQWLKSEVYRYIHTPVGEALKTKHVMTWELNWLTSIERA
jgi:hypothetical protein